MASIAQFTQACESSGSAHMVLLAYQPAMCTQETCWEKSLYTNRLGIRRVVQVESIVALSHGHEELITLR